MLCQLNTNNREEELNYSDKPQTEARVRMHTWARGRERSKGRTDGKSVCRVRFFHTACSKHDWTCSVPWHVFQLRVTTLQVTMTTTHMGVLIEQTSGDPCAMARGSVKAGNACPSNKNLRLQNGKSTTRIPNHEQLKVLNKATAHTTQPESPV